MTYKITGDLLSRKGIVVAKEIKDEAACESLIDDFTRKGWTNLKMTKEKPSDKSTKAAGRGDGRSKKLDGDKKAPAKAKSKGSS